MKNFLSNIEYIQLKNVSKNFIQSTVTTTVLNNINFQFNKNSTYILKGISGTGKSTLIYILSGLDLPSSGSIYYNNYNINSIKQDQKRILLQNSIGLIFQYPYLIGELNIIENIMLKKLISGISKDKLKLEALDLLDKIDLVHKASSYPSQLSGGEQQRVALARAIFNKPSFLIADEPTAHLDQDNKNLILNLLLECQKEWQMGLIIVSHDNILSKSIDHQLELSNGNLIYK